MAELTNDVIDTIIAEAGGDGKPGMTAVGWAIANRAAKSGISPDAVVKKPHQFEGYSNPGSGSRRAQQNAALRAQVKEIWQGIESRTIPDPLQGGTMFHASSMTPHWASAENKHGTVRIGGQTYYKGGSALPPEELPQVGTLTDTVPPRPVAPVTPSIDMAQMRRTAVPSQLGPDTFASLAKPQRPGTMTRAADIGLTGKTAVTPYLKRDGSGVMDPANVVFGGEMTTQLPGAVVARSASDAARGKTPMYSLSMGGRAPIGLIQPGNLDLNARKVFSGPQGDYRTENSMSIGTDKGEALIPTVVDGHQLTQKAAINHFLKTGENLGMFSTPAAADRYAEALHLRQEQTYKPTAPAAPRPSIPQSTIERQVAKPTAVALPRPRPQTAPSDLIQVSRQRIASTNPTSLPPVPPSTLGQKPATIVAKSIPMPAVKPFVAEARYIEPRNVTPPPVKAAFVPEARYIEPRNAMPAAVKYAGPFIPGTNVAQPNGSIVPNKPQDRLLAGVANNGVDISPGLSAPGALAYAPTPRPPIARPVTPAPPYRAVASALDVRAMPTMPIARPVMPSAPVQMPIRRPVQPPVYAQQAPMRHVAAPARPALAQAGGFLFAPSSGGGYVNVGRANPQMSPAEQYAYLNRNSSSSSSRPGSSLSTSGGERSFMER